MNTIVLDRRAKRSEAFSGLSPRIVTTLAGVGDSLSLSGSDALWISYERSLTEALVKQGLAADSGKLGMGVFVHEIDSRHLPAMESLFRRLVFRGDALTAGFLPPDELAEALQADHRERLVIGGWVDRDTETMTLWRGDLSPLIVPLSTFTPSGQAAPDFTAFAVTDSGQTIQLGAYEAAVEAILYEHDPIRRREIKEQRNAEDRSFGAALRRLRRQRGLRQGDFAPEVTAKTVARIERGEVARLQRRTLIALAHRLGVAPDAIDSY